MLERATETVNFPDDDCIDLALVRVRHQFVQFRPGLLRSGDADVNILSKYSPPATGGVLPQLGQLHFWTVSIERADTGIQGDTHYAFSGANSHCRLLFC